MRREWLMLAHTFEKGTRSIGGWYSSIKLDGQLALWDGGITRNMLCSAVPWANTVKDKKEFWATGLWSRGGKPIAAPSTWLDGLPSIMMVGELYAGRGGFQRTESAVRKHIGIEHEWNGIRFHVFDMPSPEQIFRPGRIHLRTWRPTWGNELLEFARPRLLRKNVLTSDNWPAEKVYDFLKGIKSNLVEPVEQTVLPFSDIIAQERLGQMLTAELAIGGEGLILRHPGSVWEPIRNHDYLKYKPKYYGEGTVTGFMFGKVTNDGSKHLGKMGTLLVAWNGRVFGVNGFFDEERGLGVTNTPGNRQYAMEHPGEEAPDFISCNFPRGTTVKFSYLSLTDEGVPRSANYWRYKDED